MALNVWELVISDMKHRDEVGTFKYGKPLQCNDGRRTLQDAYEEQLDNVVYTKKAILELALLFEKIKEVTDFIDTHEVPSKLYILNNNLKYTVKSIAT